MGEGRNNRAGVVQEKAGSLNGGGGKRRWGKKETTSTLPATKTANEIKVCLFRQTARCSRRHPSNVHQLVRRRVKSRRCCRAVYAQERRSAKCDAAVRHAMPHKRRAVVQTMSMTRAPVACRVMPRRQLPRALPAAAPPATPRLSRVTIRHKIWRNNQPRQRSWSREGDIHRQPNQRCLPMLPAFTR